MFNDYISLRRVSAERPPEYWIVLDANYMSAWETLKTRYNNVWILISNYLQAFLSINSSSHESVKDLKLLRDEINKVLCALKNLQRPIDQWNDFLIYVMQKLDP